MAKKILIVDDEADVVKLVSAHLRIAGYESISAIDGNTGLEMARTQNPDLIILDLMLPGLSGYEVCRMIKFDERYKHIPIILFSARTSDEDMKTAKEVGADAYVTKPYESAALLAKIKELIKA